MCSPDVAARVAGAPRFGRRALLAGLGGVAAVAAAPALATAQPPPRGASVIDLSHVVHDGFPVWPGSRSFSMRTVADNRGTATGSLGLPRPPGLFYKNELAYDEHTGTHVDAPVHVDPDGTTVEAIPVANLTAPLAVIDIADRAGSDHDTLVTLDDIARWESAHGAIPPRALVAMHSGWQTRVTQPGAFTNQDALGVQHTPGFAGDAARFLVDERGVVALGSDTLSIDAGRDTGYPAHIAALGSGAYAVEALARLDLVPAAGATVVVGAPTHADGSGGPARVLAFV
ncbi:cyclase family protein [Rhodococcus rhodnii]|nr:cyclase family protein [Rhodococcus rhodnii]TXG92530.1 cyclase family protein [Rhodococcus rhodnii]